MSEDPKAPAKPEAESPVLTPGSSVLVVDRWGKLHVLLAAIVTSTAQCDKGNYNVRILYDHHTNLPDLPVGNLRVWKKGLKLLSGERFVLVLKPEDWPIVDPASAAKAAPTAPPKPKK